MVHWSWLRERVLQTWEGLTQGQQGPACTGESPLPQGGWKGTAPQRREDSSGSCRPTACQALGVHTHVGSHSTDPIGVTPLAVVSWGCLPSPSHCKAPPSPYRMDLRGNKGLPRDFVVQPAAVWQNRDSLFLFAGTRGGPRETIQSLSLFPS